MNLLAVDTTTEKLSIALATGKDTWLFEAEAGLRHSELVMETIDILFKKAALTPEDLSGIVCMRGPGSFTGLRIGFSLAKGLALALGCPIAAIPTLDCMAKPLFSLKGLIMPVLDAKQSAFFCALYRDGKKLCADMDAAPETIASVISEAIASQEAKQVLLFGPASGLLYAKLSQLSPNPLSGIDILAGKGLRWGNAQTLLEIAQETDVFANPDFSAGPEYIRKSV